MTPSSHDRVTMTQLLIPVSMMAVTLALLMAFQTSQIMRERDAIHQAIGRMEAPFQEGQKINSQFGGLVVGTQRLAQEGSKEAQALVDRLKAMGILQPPQEQQQGQAAPVPAAMQPQQQGPVKP